MQEGIRSEILEIIKADRTDILEFTKDLVAIATENPPGVFYKPCVEAICNKLSEIGLDFEIIEVPDQALKGETPEFPRYCILSSYGTGVKTLYFHGHYDVVPAALESQFKPYIEEGNLYGRGSADMKSGLAAIIYAVKAIKTAKIELNGNIGLTIVPDEETGGRLGSRYLSDAGLLGKNGIGMLLPEPTSGVVWNANRGAISLRITIKGKPAHVGLQYEGINAFENMLAVANAILELKREVESRITKYHVQPEFARRSILMMGGRSGGGSSFNLVPGEFSFTVDRRINPEEDFAVEKQRLFTLLNSFRARGIDIEIETLQEGESAGIPEDTPLARALATNIEAIKGTRPEFEMCPGLCEIRFYAQKGIPAFAYGPGLLTVAHGPNEFVPIDDIYEHTAIYALTALDLLSDK